MSLWIGGHELESPPDPGALATLIAGSTACGVGSAALWRLSREMVSDLFAVDRQQIGHLFPFVTDGNDAENLISLALMDC
jgi:hypothetical protein